MQINNEKIKSLVLTVGSSAKLMLKERCVAVYIMGSLARGGFSEIVSDIDIGIIIEEPIEQEDKITIDKIKTRYIQKYPSVKNNISIFWGSVDSLNGVVDEGRFPPFDRIDLIDHGLLIEGTDIKPNLIRPSKKELEIAGAKFALNYLGTEEKIREFNECSLMASKGDVYITKTILFPARFIYLARTGKIAGNDVSYQYYIDNFEGDDAALIKLGYKWRLESVPTSSEDIIIPLNKGIAPLYHRFIDIYIERMESYGEEGLASQLGKWKQNIKNPSRR
ncbi:MAG: nucleotidyltransferase domain-containing protein [Moorea sp. SIO2B7]|nr:nucleotidyltransferase domain-containing protein [Moorena sp. SIO2B7]